jgi:hypothetical protein
VDNNPDRKSLRVKKSGGADKNQNKTSGLEFVHDDDIMSLGPAYLEYCVKKGWLEKRGDEPNVRYEITDKGTSKLGHVQLNFDLSAITSKGKGPKKKIKRQNK